MMRDRLARGAVSRILLLLIWDSRVLKVEVVGSSEGREVSERARAMFTA